MRIIGWTEWDNPKYERLYPQTYEEYLQVEEAITNELRSKGYKFTGDYHQNGDFGVPILDNGMVYQCTQRCWGEIMASAYPDEVDDSDGYGYCKWAWTPPEDMVAPEPN